MATHSSILEWRIPWTEEPGRLQSMGSQRVLYNQVTNNTKKKIEGSQRQGHPSSQLYVSGHWAADENTEANWSGPHGVHTCQEQKSSALCILLPQGPQGAPAEAKGRRRKEKGRRGGKGR